MSINFNGSDWATTKRWLLESKDKKLGLLVSATDHDTSNRIRGAISMINELLALEEAAFRKAANRNQT